MIMQPKAMVTKSSINIFEIKTFKKKNKSYNFRMFSNYKSSKYFKKTILNVGRPESIIRKKAQTTN